VTVLVESDFHFKVLLILAHQNFVMLINPLALFATQSALAHRSIALDKGLTVHYRNDLPGELSVPTGFSHHMLTFFLSANEQQTTYISECGEYHGSMNKGDFYLYPAGMAGHTRWRSADKTLHIVIEPDFLSKAAFEAECASPSSIELLPILKGRDRTLNNLAQLFLTTLNTSLVGEKLYLESLSSLLGVHLLRQYVNFIPKISASSTGLAPYKLKEILDYIQVHLSENLSLDTLAAQINLSRCHFAFGFKQSTGTSPHRYVSQQRVEKAKQLLKLNRLPITEVALACGFANQSHLTTVFKKYSGTTPKTYQEQL
jgi:AraC family transcriptional regulator